MAPPDTSSPWSGGARGPKALNLLRRAVLEPTASSLKKHGQWKVGMSNLYSHGVSLAVTGSMPGTGIVEHSQLGPGVRQTETLIMAVVGRRRAQHSMSL